jgi:hypothetical protein
METSASSGRTKRLFHGKSIATIYAIEHVLNVANSDLAYRYTDRDDKAIVCVSIVANSSSLEDENLSDLTKMTFFFNFNDVCHVWCPGNNKRIAPLSLAIEYQRRSISMQWHKLNGNHFRVF